MTPQKQIMQTIPYDLHISAAILDTQLLESKTKTDVQVWLGVTVAGTKKEHLLANLNRQTSQFPLDIAFDKGDTISFYIKGWCDVLLHGYFLNNGDTTSLPEW